MEIFIYLIFLIAIGIFVLQLIILHQNYKNSKSNYLRSSGQTKEYFQVKYRVDIIIAVFVIGTALFAFLGYDTKGKLEENIDNEIKASSKEIELLETEFSKLNEDIKKSETEFQKFIETIAKEGEGASEIIKSLKSGFQLYQDSLSEIQKDIAKLQETAYLKKNIYYIKEFSTPPPDDGTRYGVAKIKFSDLKTISGKSLPKFNSPPLIISFWDNKGYYGQPDIGYNTTNEHFETITTYMNKDDTVPMSRSFIIIYPLTD